MQKILMLMLMVVFAYSPLELLYAKQPPQIAPDFIDELLLGLGFGRQDLSRPNEHRHAIHLMQQANLSMPAISKVMSILDCIKKHNIIFNNVLVVIDYSLPSYKKRLWVFSLAQNKLLFNTYVAHGIKSGVMAVNYFSNKHNSKSSSIGVYRTAQTYYGREGLSLRLDGLERDFNDNASARYIVIHGSWYMDEKFIKKYGRSGRSWGCPALPICLVKPIIENIKDKSLFIVYSPHDGWENKSRFLNCNKAITKIKTQQVNTAMDDPRSDVLFANMHTKHNSEENSAIIAMSTENYQKIFHVKVPLERMLRRQINNTEYVALSTEEFKTMSLNNHEVADLQAINLVVPKIKMSRGYYETEMNIITLGKINKMTFSQPLSGLTTGTNYTICFEGKSCMNLHVSSYFIRWLGL